MAKIKQTKISLGKVYPATEKNVEKLKQYIIKLKQNGTTH